METMTIWDLGIWLVLLFLLVRLLLLWLWDGYSVMQSPTSLEGCPDEEELLMAEQRRRGTIFILLSEGIDEPLRLSGMDAMKYEVNRHLHRLRNEHRNEPLTVVVSVFHEDEIHDEWLTQVLKWRINERAQRPEIDGTEEG